MTEIFAGAEHEFKETLRNRLRKVSKNIGRNTESDVNLAQMQHILLEKSGKNWLQVAEIKCVCSVQKTLAIDDILRTTVCTV